MHYLVIAVAIVSFTQVVSAATPKLAEAQAKAKEVMSNLTGKDIYSSATLINEASREGKLPVNFDPKNQVLEERYDTAVRVIYGVYMLAIDDSKYQPSMGQLKDLALLIWYTGMEDTAAYEAAKIVLNPDSAPETTRKVAYDRMQFLLDWNKRVFAADADMQKQSLKDFCKELVEGIEKKGGSALTPFYKQKWFWIVVLIVII